MFKIELRATETLLVGKRQLTTGWQVHGQAATQKQAEVDISWIIDETKDFVSDLGRPVKIEYRISDGSGKLVSANSF